MIISRLSTTQLKLLKIHLKKNSQGVWFVHVFPNYHLMFQPNCTYTPTHCRKIHCDRKGIAKRLTEYYLISLWTFSVTWNTKMLLKCSHWLLTEVLLSFGQRRPAPTTQPAFPQGLFLHFHQLGVLVPCLLLLAC